MFPSTYTSGKAKPDTSKFNTPAYMANELTIQSAKTSKKFYERVIISKLHEYPSYVTYRKLLAGSVVNILASCQRGPGSMPDVSTRNSMWSKNWTGKFFLGFSHT